MLDKKKLAEDRQKRIEDKKKLILSKRERKLQKYSNSFNEIFLFFLKSYRADILTFCGSHVDVDFDISTDDGKFAFRRFEDGAFKQKKIISSHPNILKAVVTAKKSWGLWCSAWSDGIAECCFTKNDIYELFRKHDISIPASFTKEFENKVWIAREKYEKGIGKDFNKQLIINYTK